MAKGPKATSTSNAIRVMAAAGKQISPPSNVPLEPKDMPFFASVIDEFARADWTAHQLELAAMLARKMCDLSDLQEQLRAEGYTMVTQNGAPCQNPLIGAVRMLDTSIMATRRSLSLHARARGEARDFGKKAAISKGLESDLGDDLLARPN